METAYLESPGPSITAAPLSPRAARLSGAQPAASVAELEPASLRSLIHHSGWVEYDAPLEQVQRVFAERQVEFLALVRDGIVTGVCSRLRLGILFGTRYGFALYSRAPAHLAQIERPLVFSAGTPVREILDRTLARPREEFHDDVALVDEHHALIGLVPIDALARLQTRLVAQQFAEMRAMERQLLRQEKQKLLDTLVAGIAHELNNKLTPVQGFSELIALTADPQTRSYADLIARSVGEAGHIIRQLLQLSKPASTIRQTVDLRVLVEEALSMLRFQIRDSRCDVRLAQPPEPIWVQADGGEIKQVVINLALNGLQAMAEAGAAGLLDVGTATSRDTATFSIADTGVGISSENLERIFDPFFTTKGPERGSGLGLSVCAGIVRQHGGAIAVESQPGAGARFTVSLPLQPPPASSHHADSLPFPVGHRGSGDTSARVLVVEDETHVRRFVQTVLSTRFGCDVDTVSHGIEAFERLAVHRYALVISDLRMPAMNGTELYLWLREAQPDTARRFVFITGYPGDNHLGREIPEWEIPVLVKPFTISQLCDVCAPFLLPTGSPEIVAGCR